MGLYCSSDYQINGISVQEKKCKIDFLDSGHGCHFGFLSLQDTLMLSTKFQVNWPFGSGEEVKNRFLR